MGFGDELRRFERKHIRPNRDVFGAAFGFGVFGLSSAGVALKAAEIKAQREAGQAKKREAERQALQRLSQVEEANRLRRIASSRFASSQRARQGAAGVRGSGTLVIQQSLLDAFDEIRRARKAGLVDAQSLRRQGRNQEKAANRQSVLTGANAILDAGFKIAGMVT